MAALEEEVGARFRAQSVLTQMEAIQGPLRCSGLGLSRHKQATSLCSQDPK